MPRLIAPAAILAAVLALLSCAGPESADVAWLDAHVIPLGGCDPDQGVTDLAPLADLIGDARIVGLGESTHGTREHFQLKHRLVRYLVEEQGFDIFAIEASTPEAHRLDAYVLGGEGDPGALIGGMYFWTWNTEEVLAMVEWMRAHNARSDHKIHFTGFDMQTPDVAAEQVVAFLESVDPQRARDVKNSYAELIKARGGSPFATATYTFPVDEARGKKARFSAWICTKDVADGYAGLWWRADGPGRQVLAFDNMMDRGITGTTDWTEHVIELDLPDSTVNINFGFLLTGQGEAWFDDAAIALDGEVRPAGELDLGFEGSSPAANYLPRDDNYVWALDRAVVHGGAQSLRLAGVGRATDTTDMDAVMRDARAILSDLEGQREAWLAARPAAEVDRALFNARLVLQCLSARASQQGGYARDEAMAENVVWLAEQHPDARIVLWAHNWHVSRGDFAMGAHLADSFGDAYLPVGFATARGRYYAMSRSPSGERQHALQAPPEDSFEARFATAAAPVFALDLRLAEPGGEASGWLCEARPFRSVGAMAMEQQFAPTPLREMYDVVVFVEETEPARQLETVAGRR